MSHGQDEGAQDAPDNARTIPSITRNAPPPVEILAGLGRTMEEFQADFEYLARNRNELTARFPDKWVAVFDGSVVATSSSAEDLTPKLAQKGLKRSQTVIDYLSTKPVTLRL